jgi:hypothetical protein
MTKELYIAGERVVLDDKQAIAPTYQAFDVAELTRIKFDFTNTFTLPYCEINDKIFDNAFRVQSQSSKRYLANECKLIIGGKELISNGVAEFIGTDDKGYKVVCYSLPLSFFNDIAGLSIRDLNYSGYEHELKASDFVAYQNNTEKFAYPICDWFRNSPNNFVPFETRIVDTRYQQPFLFYHEILEKIFTEKGYTLNNITKTHPFFNNYELLVSTDAENIRILNANSINVENINSNYSTTTVVAFAPVRFGTVTGNNTWYENVNDDFTTDIIGHTPSTVTNFDVSLFTPDKDGFYTFNLTANGSKFTGNAPILYISFCEVIGSSIQEITRSTQNLSGAAVIFAGTFNSTRFCEAGKKYCFIVTIDDSPGNAQFTLQITTLSIKTFDAYPELFVPDIEQRDFIKNYLQLTGSILTYDNYTNIFTIERFDKVIENKPNAKDWTNKKYDNTKKPTISHSIKGYAVANKFVYTEDENDEKPIQTDGYINSNNQNLDKEKEIVKLLYAGTLNVIRYKGLSVPNIKVFDIIDNVPQKANKIVPRLVLAKKITLPSNDLLTFNDGTNTATTNTVMVAHFYFFSETSNLGFGSNILDTFYQWLQSILNDTIVIEDEYKLSEADVANDTLDFLTPVYLQQHNNYFYINEIRNFIRDKKTKVKLIKV